MRIRLMARSSGVRLSPALALGLGLCASLFPSPPASAEKVRVTTPVETMSETALYIAKDKGFFAAEGLEVEVIVTGGSGPDVQALLAGEVQFSYTPGTFAIRALHQGKPIQAVMTALNRCIINVAMHKEVAQARGIGPHTPVEEKLKALKGLKLGATRVGALTYDLAYYFARKVGLEPQKDLTILGMGAGGALIAGLEQRKIDAFLTATPVPETAVQRGHAILLVNNARGEFPDLKEFLMINVLVRPEFAKQNPELVRRMVRALVRANQWALDRSAGEVRDVLAKSLKGIDPAVLLEAVENVRPAISRDGMTTDGMVKATLDVLEAGGLTRPRINLADVATNEYLPR